MPRRNAVLRPLNGTSTASYLPRWHYGYDLSRRLQLSSGTLYPILVRLAERGSLETRWVVPERPGRPPRHTYRLTGDGRALARSRLAEAAWSSLVRRPASEGAG